MAQNIIIKVTQDCNMSCNYPCYYYHQKSRQPIIMETSLMRNFIQQLPEVENDGKINFIYHGGEPTLAGVDWYREVLSFQSGLSKRCKAEINNTMQTNGFIVDDSWARFFKEYDFEIGVSIDGPTHIHNKHRRLVGGEPTFDSVQNTIKLLQKHNVMHGALTVVASDSLGHATEILDFLVGLGLRSFDFLPNMEYTKSGRLTKYSVSGTEFAHFVCDIFERWVKLDDEDLRVRVIDQVVGGLLGYCPNLCTFSEGCGGVMCLDVQGDVYPCDEYVYSSERKLGNIKHIPLTEILSNEKYADYLACAIDLPDNCLKCQFSGICAGNCVKFRLRNNEMDNCKGRKYIYSYIKKRLGELGFL
ncbi:radical SAM protein [Patescibacteria group bacterium]